ncbi:MAG TPA: S-adenosylmethionine:tRNA ribosyltransferase-isomerase [Thermoanaerobaculia bacterium]|jgi:S-adenosylmethionine:tRNA ribosyltransferase-isomerase
MTSLDFDLPAHLEAKMPAELRGDGRDDVRMLVTRRADDAVFHAHFRELPSFLEPGDLLVLNSTATLPAALTATRGNGEAIALHVSTPLPGGLVIVEPRRVQAQEGERLLLPDGVEATLLTRYRDSVRLWIAQLNLRGTLHDYLRGHGRPITYSYVSERFPLDAYQTVYATEPGSAEMPSAGRAFTKRMLACLRRSGVRLAKLVLHAGVASLEDHERPYDEYYEVPARTAEEVRRARAGGHRVIAVGTTVVRALESSVHADGNVIASRGWTDLVITPERGVRVVDALLTGFHEPKATHLAMLEAIGGSAHVEKAYREALSGGYLWHEFGDLHLMFSS